MQRAALILLLVILFPVTGVSTLIVYGELDVVPTADNVGGLVNWPAFPSNAPQLAVQHGITLEDLRRFLREGKRAASAGSGGGSSKYNNCRGMFFTKDGEGYYFFLGSARSIAIISADLKRCRLTLAGAGIEPFVKKVVYRDDIPLKESPREVRAFLDRPRPDEGPSSAIVTAGILQRFLRKGVRLPEARKYYQLRAGGSTDSGPRFFSRPAFAGSGGFMDENGHSYLWRFFDRDWLWLERDDGRVAFYLMLDRQHVLQATTEYLEGHDKRVREFLERNGEQAERPGN